MDTELASSIEDDFLLLVKEGNYDEVLNYLNHYDIDLEYTNEDHDDCTALVIAASEGFFNICQLLIEKGANMYAGNSVSVFIPNLPFLTKSDNIGELESFNACMCIWSLPVSRVFY